jgi:imidazolonepropionase-like amidohydrolase
MRRVIPTAIAATFGLAVLAAVPAQGQVTAYEGGRLIVGDGSVIENGTLVVDGTKLVQAGSAKDVKVPAGAKRVDLKGKTVMPMIIDTHVHLTSKRDALIRDLKQRAYWGVSAAMSMGHDTLDVLPIRNETIPGAARYLSAGRGITRPEPLSTTIHINSEEEARKAVQLNAANQIEIIKIWVDDRFGKVQKLTPSQYGAIIDEAHKHKMRVTAHIFEQADAKGLMKAGVDAFAHGIRNMDIDDEMVSMFKERPNFILNPNLPDRGVKVDRNWLKSALSADAFAKLEATNTDRPKAQAFHGIQARNLAKLNKVGVRIVMGTDGNRPWAPHEEMEDMVLAGMTTMQVIMASTRNGAEFLRIADAGTLTAGKSADFIVLDANPVENITNTRRISQVVLRGAPVSRTTYPQ